MMNMNELKYALSSLCVFRNLLSDKELSLFYKLLCCEDCVLEKISVYSEFVSSLYKHSASFSDYLKKAVFEDENAYVVLKAKNKEIPSSILESLEYELGVFTILSDIKEDDIRAFISYDGYIPHFENEHTDFKTCYFDRIEKISTLGYGIFASSPMFKVVDGVIVPVESNDTITVDSLVGYDDERQAVIDNTVALVEGRPAANVLLYGDAGTGKSSTVKAVANLMFNKGVRLIELRKDQLLSLSDIMSKISENPLKFIIFIDDLSFNKNDDQFSMLKAALEGSASVKSANSVIYATSNRRHIVKETFSDRASSGDDIHRNDTVQELLSLSDRFGLTVYFSKPGKNLYLEIVRHLVERYEVRYDEELGIKAEAFALSRGNRSPRVAEQFVINLIKTI